MSTATRRRGEWKEVTASDPCPICEHTKWCRVSTDGLKANCRRHSRSPVYGEGRHKVDKAGAQCWIYTLAETNGNGAPPITIHRPAEPKRAEPEQLHEVYSALLAELQLSTSHQNSLEARGIPLVGDNGAFARQYRTMPIQGRPRIATALARRFGDVLATVPGFYHAAGERGDYLTIAGAAGLIVPTRDTQGRIVALKVRRDDAGDDGKYSSISSRSEKKNRSGPSPGSPIHVPLGVVGPIDVIRVTEGGLKADAATVQSGLPTIALPSCSASRALPQVLRDLGVKTVRLALDADFREKPQVAHGLHANYKQLTAAGFVVDLEVWDPAAGKGIDDVLVAKGTTEIVTGQTAVEVIAKAVADTKAADFTPSGKPVIVIGTDEKRVNDEAVAALATSPHIYQRASKLVYVVRDPIKAHGIDRPADSPAIISLPTPMLRETLTDVCQFVSIKKDNETGEEKLVNERPPHWCYTAVEARGQWDSVRRLEAVVETPMLLPSGQVLQTPGYDPASGIMFEPPCKFPPVPDKPSQAQAKAAAESLLEVVCDFPFRSPAHRSAWLAGVLTPFARHAFRGPAPLFLIDANMRGSGKSLATDVTAEIVTGREFPRTSMPSDDDECRKRITSIAMLGEAILLLDNIDGAFGCPSLDAALTATVWTDRLLGKNEMVRNLPLLTVWYATGNNVQPRGDTARRICHIRLESKSETPEERTGFKHPNLLPWVRRERPRLVASALTILRGYFAAGKPDLKLSPWGSFEGWSGSVRAAVVWAGQPDPAETRIELRQRTDRDTSTVRLLIEGWHEADPKGQGLTVAQAIKMLTDFPNALDPLRTAFTELTPIGKPFAARGISQKMATYRQRVSGGRYLDFDDDTKLGKVWTVYSVDKIDKIDKFSATPREKFSHPRDAYGADAGANTAKPVDLVDLVDLVDDGAEVDAFMSS